MILPTHRVDGHRDDALEQKVCNRKSHGQTAPTKCKERNIAGGDSRLYARISAFECSWKQVSDVGSREGSNFDELGCDA